MGSALAWLIFQDSERVRAGAEDHRLSPRHERCVGGPLDVKDPLRTCPSSQGQKAEEPRFTGTPRTLSPTVLAQFTATPRRAFSPKCLIGSGSKVDSLGWRKRGEIHVYSIFFFLLQSVRFDEI